MTMHPVIPYDLHRYEAPGCCVRRAGSQGAETLWSLTLWLNGRVYQAHLLCEGVPDLLAVMSHFDRRRQHWGEVTPSSKL